MKNRGTICLFTIISTNYTAQAAIFIETVRNVYPDAEIFVFTTDSYKVDSGWAFEGATLINVGSIGFPDYDNYCARYTPIELNTSVKPLCFAYILNIGRYEQVFYVDPDTWFCSRMAEAHDLLADGASLVLTPHTTEPIEDSQKPNDGHMAQSGIFNLGFCGLRDCPPARDFIGWWARKLRRDCRVDIANGVFVDQKWCDAAPALVPGAAILRHPGYNVGYWNLMHRAIERGEDGALSVNGEPLRFLHFSGLPMRDAKTISVHQDRFAGSHLTPLVNDIVLAYRMKLISKKYFNFSRCRYQPDIHKIIGSAALARILLVYYDKYVLGTFDIEFRRFALEAPMTNRAARLHFGEGTLISDLVAAVYLARPDLREHFGQHPGDGEDGRAFESKLLGWAGDRLCAEHQPDLALAARHDMLITVMAEAGKIKERAPTGGPELAWGRLLGDLPADRLFALAHSFCTGFGAAGVEAPTPEFVSVVLETRADVRKAFDVADAEGRRGLLRWLADCFPAEYGRPMSLSAFFDALDLKGEGWTDAVGRGDAPPAPPADRALVAALDWGLLHPRDYAIHRQKRAPGPIPLRRRRDGALLVGYPRAEMGMGEHVRNTAAALASRGYPFEIFDFDSGLDCGVGDRSCEAWITSDLRHRQVNLLHVNADQTLALHSCLGDSFFSAAEHNVGYWAWELERFPREWSGAIDLVDELWAPSEFIADALRMSTAKPVTVMPLRVEPGKAEDPGLQRYGVGPDDFVFLFYFDFSSFKQRKNPKGVLDAFQRAFPDRIRDSDVRLVIKTIGEARHPEAVRRLRAEVANDPRVVIIPGTLPKAQLNGLIARCSAFVSLHRSEGFGRGLAEAMWYGKPAIGTGYSGNLDFMSAETAYLVDYDLVPVREGEYVHPSGSRWAAPHIDHAAALMREVREGYAAALQRAALGQAHIRSRHSTASVADRILRRLGAVAGPLANQSAAE